ncbi:MAG: preprotein translocase subunit SecE [Aeromonadales bacterium]|jgi:preprotein translocase subunit SecE|nr:preprotein translocase subunit SecE [Aeromonadales bacterium]MDY2891839.1 preprotein translocase subunit SecE [Succinivibrio sp.]
MSETASKAAKPAAKAVAAQAAAKVPAVKKKAVKKAKGKEQFVSTPVNALLWIISAVLICGAIFGNYYYSNYVVIDESTIQRLGRVGAVIAAIVAGLALLLLTNRGHELLKFASESYTELLKVVWPTRQEAVQTTVIVFIAVCVVSLFLYLCDIVFLEIVRAITL